MKGLTSNKLKIIAIITMVLDHIGYYFVSYISDTTFDILRFVGRMAMPIFAFLLVQGFLNTKNVKKYIFRLFVVATVFQLLIYILGIVNNVFVKNYYIVINTYLNILYSFVVCLIILKIIDNVSIQKNKVIDSVLKILLAISLLFVYVFIDMELGYRVPITVLGIYMAEKLYRENKIKTEGYFLTVFAVLVVSLFADFKNMIFNLPAVLAIVPLSLYNGSIGKKNKVLKYFFYVFYPVHHVILYIMALLITYKVR